MMENQIFYFTGTGNCLLISREIAKALGDTEIRSIARDDITYPIESLGIITPIYFGALPSIVYDFVHNLDANQISYIYSVVTNNGYAGATHHIINKILINKGKCLNAGFSILMPGNYLPMYAPLPEEEQLERIKEGKDKIPEIVEIVKKKQDIKVSGIGRILSFMQKRNNRKLKLRDEKFWTDDNCNSCGICEKICPVSNIEMVEGKPKWLHKCQQCMACIHWCPQLSIQVGKKTLGRARYHNPEISLKDLIK